ncbi:MAG: GIY-YIG nuclease family protein [Candidatus Chisholmbacteria bacterium]|nr:GIY-YIG nuclease family protein [Candidatus Chisholmbacteria bacterium]
MPWFVYILECRDNSLYTGITWNLKKRILEHNTRIKSSLQLSKIPVRLIYWQRFRNRYDAAAREKEIKGWRREKKYRLANSLRRGTPVTKRRVAQLFTLKISDEILRGYAHGLHL